MSPALGAQNLGSSSPSLKVHSSSLPAVPWICLTRDREGKKNEHTQSRVQEGYGPAGNVHSDGAAATRNLSSDFV